MYRTKQATSVSKAGSWSPLASLRVQCIARSKQRVSAKLARGRLWQACECNVSHEASNECLRSWLVVAFGELASAKLHIFRDIPTSTFHKKL